MKKKLNLILPEYEKIFRILNGIHAFFNEGDPPSCQFYNFTGAFILSKFYNIKAFPMIGAAFIKMDNHTDNVLAFAHTDFRVANSDSDHFHCWIETEDHYLDFTAPVYNDYPNSPGAPRKLMFQKPRTSMSRSQFDLLKSGDFYFKPNVDLTLQQIQMGSESTKLSDALEIAFKWIQDSKKTLQKTTLIQADDGEIIKLTASNIAIEGSW